MHFVKFLFHVPAANGNRNLSTSEAFPDQADLLDGGAKNDDDADDVTSTGSVHEATVHELQVKGASKSVDLLKNKVDFMKK